MSSNIVVALNSIPFVNKNLPSKVIKNYQGHSEIFELIPRIKKDLNKLIQLVCLNRLSFVKWKWINISLNLII